MVRPVVLTEMTVDAKAALPNRPVCEVRNYDCDMTGTRNHRVASLCLALKADARMGMNIRVGARQLWAKSSPGYQVAEDSREQFEQARQQDPPER